MHSHVLHNTFITLSVFAGGAIYLYEFHLQRPSVTFNELMALAMLYMITRYFVYTCSGSFPYNGICCIDVFLAHLSRRLTRWAYRIPVEPASVRPSVRVSTLSNMNISETNGLIATKFYLKHHWVGERLHLVLGQIGSELWFPWQQKAPIGYNGENSVSTFSRPVVHSDPFHTCR